MSNQIFTESAHSATECIHSTLNIIVIHDSRPGHLTQLEGLTQRLASHQPVNVSWVAANSHKIQWPRLFKRKRLSKNSEQVDMVIGAGHSTHKAVLFAAHHYHAISVLLMKPSLPLKLFNLVICPKHDGIQESKRILNTFGPLNKIEPSALSLSHRTKHLMLIGGPSKHFDWHQDKLIDEIKTLCFNDTAIKWQLSDSPRTPPQFFPALRQLSIPNLSCHHYNDPSFEALNTALPKSAETWVTADSMSMLYEAMTSGSPTAVFNLRPSNVKRPGRIACHIKQLIEESTISCFDQWKLNPGMPLSSTKLWEADRAALWLLSKYQDLASVNRHA